MSGEAYAIACAFLWATSSALIKSQVARIPVMLLNMLRAAPAVLIFWTLLLFSDRLGSFLQLPLRVWGFLTASTLISLVIGDQVYFQSMKLIGLSRAMPLSATYPFFTMLLAWVFLREDLDWTIAGGAVLIAAGAYLLAFPRSGARLDRSLAASRLNFAGVALALVAAACWAISTVLLRIGLHDVDVVIANTVRLSVMTVVLLPLSLTRAKMAQVKSYDLRTLGIVFLAGIIGTALGTFTFLSSVQRAGAAKTSILTATTPLFGVFYSLILKEKLPVRTLAGTALTVIGIWLTVYQPW